MADGLTETSNKDRESQKDTIERLFRDYLETIEGLLRDLI